MVEGGAVQVLGDGLVAETWGGGAGLVDNELKGVRARRRQDLLRDAREMSLLTDDDG
jgi:hypothetical protein